MPEVTAAQAAEIVGISDDSIRNYVDRDLLPARRQGIQRKIFIELDDLKVFASQYDFRFNEDAAEQITRQ